MSAAEFLAESKRQEIAPHETATYYWRNHARTALPRMREALEAVLRIHIVEEYSGGGPESSDGAICLGCQYELDGDESCCPTVRAIESALAENGEE